MRNREISQSAAVEKLIITEDYLKLQWNLRCGPSSGDKLDSTYSENGIIGGKITTLKRAVSFCSNY